MAKPSMNNIQWHAQSHSAEAWASFDTLLFVSYGCRRRCATERFSWKPSRRMITSQTSLLNISRRCGSTSLPLQGSV
eukprot:6333420-Heterocapsa_arctica.AAC.1